MLEVIEQSKRYSENQLIKIGKYQQKYLRDYEDLFSDKQRINIERKFKAVQHKFFLSMTTLEQLWALSEDSRLNFFDALENAVEKLEWSESEKVLGSLSLECFLFETQSFMEVFMFYICLLLNIEKPPQMTYTKFKKILRKIKDNDFIVRAEKIIDYYEKHIYSKNGWGTLLESLRNRVCHYDYIRESRDGTESIVGEILLDWPTLRKQTYDRFCQYIQNNAFEMIRDLTPILYLNPWIAGSHNQIL